MFAHRREIRLTFLAWLAITRFQRQAETQQRDTSARVLQLALRAWVTRTYQLRDDASARSIQRVVRGHHARRRCLRLRVIAQKKREQRAAVRIQSRVRGLLARARYAKLLKQLRDRFRCANCGVIEPSGAYCKLCGRKRAHFDLLLSPRHGALKTESSGVSCKTAMDVVHRIQLQMTPTRPPAPPPSSSPTFARLQAAKNRSIRRVVSVSSQLLPATTPADASAPELLIPLALPAISRLDSLPMVLSPHHSVQNARPALRKRPSCNHRPQRRIDTTSNQLESHAPPLPAALALAEPPKAVADTKLRAQALTKLLSHQQQLQEANCTPALAQHMHRLQRAGLAATRSR